MGFIPQFDITKKYIKGVDNEVTDSWSRLCAVSDKTKYLTALEEGECPPHQYLILMRYTLHPSRQRRMG